MLPILLVTYNKIKGVMYMYDLLVAIRNFSVPVNVIIFIALFLFGGPLLCIIYTVFLIKSRQTDIKRYTNEIEYFSKCYERIRPYLFECKDRIIYIGSYVTENEGKVCYLSKFMSLYAKNISNQFMTNNTYAEQKQIEGDIYFQFPIKNKYSKTEKITIINGLIEQIANQYSSDKFNVDRSIPIGMAVVFEQ